MNTEKIKVRTENGQTMEVVVLSKRASGIEIVLGEGIHNVKCELTPTRNGLSYAGSIMGLEPGTPYQVRLRLFAPGAAEAVAMRTLELATWSEPVAPEPGRVVELVPGELGRARSVSAGDLVLFPPGVYKGPLNVSSSGTPERPWRSSSAVMASSRRVQSATR